VSNLHHGESNMAEKRDVAYSRGARGGRDGCGRGRSGGAPFAHRARGGEETRTGNGGGRTCLVGPSRVWSCSLFIGAAGGRLNRIRNRVRQGAVSSDWSAVGVATPGVGGARHVVWWAVASGSRNRNAARARHSSAQSHER
jgi:hypothetical protein